jgi:hypothetical protein
VFHGAHAREQIEILEDEANLLVPYFGELIAI